MFYIAPFLKLDIDFVTFLTTRMFVKPSQVPAAYWCCFVRILDSAAPMTKYADSIDLKSYI